MKLYVALHIGITYTTQCSIILYILVNNAELDADKKESAGFVPGVGGYAKPGSGKKTLKTIQTHFYVGSEVRRLILYYISYCGDHSTR